VQTLVFVTLGLAQLGVAAALRTSSGGTGGVRFLDLAIAGSVMLLALGVFASPLHTLLETTTPTPSELLVATVGAMVPGSLIAFQRGLIRRLHPGGFNDPRISPPDSDPPDTGDQSATRDPVG